MEEVIKPFVSILFLIDFTAGEEKSESFPSNLSTREFSSGQETLGGTEEHLCSPLSSPLSSELGSVSVVRTGSVGTLGTSFAHQLGTGGVALPLVST